MAAFELASCLTYLNTSFKPVCVMQTGFVSFLVKERKM